MKEISFSAHADYSETKDFVDQLEPPYIVLVHGDSNQMLKLKKSLDEFHKENNRAIQIFTPKNCEIVKLTFTSQKFAKCMGTASKIFEDNLEGSKLSGLLVKREFDLRIMAPEDLINYTNIHTVSINQKLVVPYHSTIPHLYYVLQQMYDEICFTFPSSNQVISSDKSHLISNNVNSILVSKSLLIENKIHSFTPPALILKWSSNPITDLIADSVAAIVINIHSHPLPSEHLGHSHSHSHSHSEHSSSTFGDSKIKKEYELIENKEDENKNITHSFEISSVIIHFLFFLSTFLHFFLKKLITEQNIPQNGTCL